MMAPPWEKKQNIFTFEDLKNKLPLTLGFPVSLCLSHRRTAVIIWSKWQYSIRGPAVQRVPVRHREEWSHSGVSPERRHRGLPHGGPILRPAQPVWWTTRPCGGEEGWATSFYTSSSFSDTSPFFFFFFLSALIIVLKVCVFLQAFAENVLSKADVIQATGDAVCIFKELQCLTPRGR